MTEQNTRPTPSSDVAAKMRLPWTYVPSTPLQADWIEDCNGEIVVDCIGHIDGPFIVERANAALSASPAQVEVTDERPWVARIHEALDEGDGFWRSCSGCHELNEGHPTGDYSAAFRTHVGCGCSECGGLGVVWDNTDYADMGDYLAALTATDAKPVVPAEPVAFQFWLEVQQCWTNMPTDWKPEEDPEGKYTIRPLYAAPPSPVEGEVERLSFDDLQTLIQVRDRRHSIIESSTDRLLQAFALSDRGLLALEQLPSGADLHITRKGRKAIDAALASEGKTDA